MPRSPRRGSVPGSRNSRGTARTTALAGLVASVVLIANIVSFAALMFPGELSVGHPVRHLWSMLVGSAIGGAWIAWATSLPPLATGIDSPTGTFLVLLSASAGSAVLASGDGAQAAVHDGDADLHRRDADVRRAAATSSALFRWGPYFRFVPYFVAGGFLAATGWFLLAGGVRMTTGHALRPSALRGALVAVPAREARQRGRRVPGAAGGAALDQVRASRCPSRCSRCAWSGACVLRALGLGGPEHGWYLASIGTLAPWSPFDAVHEAHFTWPMIVDARARVRSR